jgi:hypothetical protein
MSIQPGRPMLTVLREMLRKLECAANSQAPAADLKRILERRIARMEDAQRQAANSHDR